MAKVKTPKLSAVSMDNENKWRAEADLNTLSEAKKIKADKKRYQAACAVAKEKLSHYAALSSDTDGDMENEAVKDGDE